MTSTVDDVIMLKKWRSNTDERDTLELLEEFVRFSRNKNDREFTPLNAAQYIVMYNTPHRVVDDIDVAVVRSYNNEQRFRAQRW